MLGIILTGSQARGMGTAHSDHDVLIVVEAFTDAWPGAGVRTPELDTIPYLLEWMSDTGRYWIRYTFRGAEVLLDRTPGAVLAGLCEAQCVIPPDEAATRTREQLDAYINQVYRAAKNRRDGRDVQARLDTMESVAWFLDTLFSMYGRVRPYNKYLLWELSTYPLDAPWDTEQFPRRLADDPAGLFDDLEAFARERGYGDVYDAWGESELALLRRGWGRAGLSTMDG